MTEGYPRLAVVSDVVPTRTVGGELLLYRLLADWPADRLRVLGGDAIPSDPGRRLPGVRYDRVRYAVPRLSRTRLHREWNAVLLAARPALDGAVAGRLADFRPDAVLTVAHGHLWLAAARLARRLRVPLHVIAHDQWSTMTPFPAWAARAADRQAEQVGRKAASWLCVSPAMADEFRRRYGAAGRVLYPNRGVDSPEPRVRVRPERTGVVAYAGSLWGGGYTDQLADLAAALAPHGGRVDLYTDQPIGPLVGVPNVRPAGFFPSRELAERVAATADLLFAPMSFLSADRRAMTTAFPSKLADYTAIGLPILVCGPEYCSAVRWAAEFPGVAEVVTEQGREPLAAAVGRLAADPARRVAMAARAVAAGERCFSAAAARAVFYRAVGAGELGPQEKAVRNPE